MTTIQVHYDGWLSHPADARQTLGVSTGDRLDVELVDGALVLRPARLPKAMAAMPSEDPAETSEATPAPAETAPKRGPGRPRKLNGPGLVPNIKVGGRRRSAAPLAPQG